MNAYKDGVYTVEYDISEATLDPEGGWEFPDVGEIDCVSVQMGNEENYEGFKLQTIEFKEPIQTGTTTPTADPNATADPDKTADPNATADPDKTTAPTVAPTATPKVTAKFANGQDTVQIEEEGETTITVTTDKGTVKTVKFAAVTADVANVDNTNPAAIKVTGKNAGTTEIKGSVTLTIDGKDVVIDNVSAGTLTVVPKGTPIVEAEVESAEIEMIAGTTGKVKVKNVTVTVSGEADPDANVTYAWTIDPETVAKISGTTAEATATVTAEAKGTAKATVTITATTKDGKSSQPLKKEVTVNVCEKLTVDTEAIEYAENQVAINGTVAPKALLGKTVKTNGDIVDVAWTIVETAGVEKAETETASIDAKTGVVTGKKAGTVKVKATVKVTGPLDQKETVVVEGTVIVNGDIINIDITKFKGGNDKVTCTKKDDGSVDIVWAADSQNYSNAVVSFDALDLTDWYCTIEASGSNTSVEILDAHCVEADWGNPYSVIAPQYGKSFPRKIQLSDTMKNPAKAYDKKPEFDKDNKTTITNGAVEQTPEYKSVNRVQLFKGEQTEELKLNVKSIKFYKNESDIPSGDWRTD